jgi:SGNH hydrolase-like domain, acetyltransferase AlgX
MTSLFTRTVKQIATYTTVLLITWLLLEIVLIFLDPWLFKGFFQYDRELGFRVRAHTNGSNEFGFNDIDRPHAKPANTYRIIVLGDSFNWAGGKSCNYISLLGKKLENERISGKKIEVINVGYPATGPYEEFLALKRYGLLYDPDLVIFGFFAGNDFNGMAPHQKQIVLNANFYTINRSEEYFLFGAPIILKSRVLEIISQHKKIVREVQTEPTSQKHDESADCLFSSEPMFTETAFLQLAVEKLGFHGSKYQGYFEAHIDYVSQTIHTMKEYLTGRDIDFKVVILPDEMQVDPKLLTAAIDYGQITRSDLEIDRPQKLMHGILTAENIDYLDLLPMFRTTFAKNPEQPLYLLRDTHWNLSGNDLAAEAIYQWLKPTLQNGDENSK